MSVFAVLDTEQTIDGGESVAAGVAVFGVDDAGDDIALDELPLAACCLAEGCGSETVEIAHGAEGGLVEQRCGIGGEDLAIAAGAAQPETKVFSGVVGSEGADLESVVDAREERAVAAQREAIAEFGQADQDEREAMTYSPLWPKTSSGTSLPTVECAGYVRSIACQD